MCAAAWSAQASQADGWGSRDAMKLSAFGYQLSALFGAAIAMAGCARPRSASGSENVELRVWAMGREGEGLQELLPEFERRNPGVRVRVQQVPWTAAHEKLLTSYVGESTPDISQLGNTWIPEFAA